jgi:hypothetical protein
MENPKEDYRLRLNDFNISLSNLDRLGFLRYLDRNEDNIGNFRVRIRALSILGYYLTIPVIGAYTICKGIEKFLN